MTDLQVFTNSQFGSIRTAMRDGAPLFVAADVCKALDIDRTQTRRLDDDEKGVCLTQTPGGEQGLTVVTESGLYSLVLGSRKSEAKAFKRWITHDVIPAIRKTGGYVNNDDAFIGTYLPYADEATKSMFRQTLGAVRALNDKIQQDRPKVLFADAVSASHTSILVGELAKLLKQNGIDMGQNRLFAWLRVNGFLCAYGERYNMPSQYAMERGLFEVKETTINQPDGSIRIVRTVKVTGKGQQYFINKFFTERCCAKVE